MTAKFTHYLVTRFNVPVEAWNKDKAGRHTLDDAWIQHRLSLFERYCAPSVLSQSDKSFKWLIYCSPETSPLHLNTIQEMIRDIPSVSIRKAETFNKLMEDLKAVMSQVETQYIITSRLDNDDALGKNFIKNVSHHFQEEDRLLLNQLGGVIYDVHENVMTKIKGYKNHFTSLIEKKGDPSSLITVLGFPHDQPPAGIKILNLEVEHAWLKIIHERNVKSRLIGKPVFHFSNIDFPAIKAVHLSLSIVNTMKYIFKRIANRK